MPNMPQDPMSSIKQVKSLLFKSNPKSCLHDLCPNSTAYTIIYTLQVVLPSGVSRPASSTAPYSLPTLPTQPVSPTAIASTPPLPTVDAPVLAPWHPPMSPTPALSNYSNASMPPPVTASPVVLASGTSGSLAPNPIANHSPTVGPIGTPPNSANVTIVGGVTDLAALTANGTISCGMNPTPYIAGGANTSTVR